MAPTDKPAAQRLTREQAREALSAELRPTFDRLCDETVAWSKYFYGTTMISYSILKHLVEDGWTNPKERTQK
jgi:hypothetical protein